MRHLFCLVLLLIALPIVAADKPNVILIITDDQGYGDVGAHGNEILKTPNLDALHKESIRLTDYHVDPTCSPTRSALMTGRYSTRTGVWHTINGRSMMDGDEYTMAEYFRDNGYNTAMFGKWHLGDNAPCRPQDQGFDHVVWHKGGGVGQGPDYLGNDYFDDTYVDHDGQYKKFDGYCTDVWFREAMAYVDDAKEKDEPFFVYLSTNAPHGPFIVDEKYSKPYKDLGVPGDSAPFYGMIANIDENLGKLRAYLDEQGLAENTILIYTTDNGTARGLFQNKEKKSIKGFNAGMRKGKGSEYDGGHRVPFFLHWPKGGLNQGRDNYRLAAHVDVFPTLRVLCGLEPPDDAKLKRGPMDGMALFGQSLPEGAIPHELATRTLFVHSQRVYMPEKWRKSAVMTERWRLVNGKELYDIDKDPGQQNDIAADHADVVERLRGEYDKWWASLEPVFDDVVRYDLGGAENPTTLMSHDWLMEKGNAAWHQNSVRGNALINGPFMVNVKKAGKYRITPMRWPAYMDKPSGVILSKVEVTVGDTTHNREIPVEPNQPVGPIEFTLPTGHATLMTTLLREDGKTFGAYYLKVEYLGEKEE
jgi:arylsulfatase A-like enzyme